MQKMFANVCQSTRSIPSAVTGGLRAMAWATSAFTMGSSSIASGQTPALPWPDVALNGTYESRCTAIRDLPASYTTKPAANATSRSAAFAVFTENYFRRVYTFDRGHTIAQFTWYADKECQKPLVAGKWEEIHTLGGASKTAPGARKFDNIVWKRFLTILSPEMLPLTKNCGTAPWGVGIERDVTKGSCPGFGALYPPMGDSWLSRTLIAVTPEGIRLSRNQPDDSIMDPDGRPRILLDEKFTLYRYVP